MEPTCGERSTWTSSSPPPGSARGASTGLCFSSPAHIISTGHLENMEQATSTFLNDEDHSCIEACTSSSSGRQAEASPTQNDLTKKAVQEFLADVQNLEMKVHVGEKAVPVPGVGMIKTKMHRYPTTIQSLRERHTMVPTVVAIGPYYHRSKDLSNKSENWKHVAAYHYTRQSGHSVLQKMYDKVVSVAPYARSLYDKKAVTGISDHEFRPMMLFDACFLVQYMLFHTDGHEQMVEPSLRGFFRSNHKELEHDIFLLENQLPWLVVETVMRFIRHVPLEDIIAPWKAYLQGRKHDEQKPFVLDSSYKPPHLLGLLRFYIVGRRSNIERNEQPRRDKTGSMSYSVSVLGEIGIRLAANKTTTELIHMGVNKKGVLFGELSLVPLYLNEERASFLINMAALELCMTPDFEQAAEEDSVVCSYLLLLAMLVHKKEDVQKLRKRHYLLEKGLRAGLRNRDALDFFLSFQSLPEGSSYTRIMAEITNYKVNRQLQIKVLAFVHKNGKTIVKLFSAIGVILGIIGSLVGILNKLKSVKG